MEAINPTPVTEVEGVRWTAYPVQVVNENHEIRRIAREEGSTTDTFDVHNAAELGGLKVYWSYRSTYGNTTGIVPELTPELRSEVERVWELAEMDRWS